MYSRLEVVVGESVDLVCNASLRTDVMWSYDNDDPCVQYVYWNGRIATDKHRLVTKFTGGNSHKLMILDIQLNDSGLYNCYDENGLRKIGYQLIVNGM